MKPTANGSPATDDGAAKIWREPSCDIWRKDDPAAKQSNGKEADGEAGEFRFQQQKPTEDPPSQLIGQFLHKQKASGDFSLDMDLEMQELTQDANVAARDGVAMSPVVESPLKARSSPSDEARVRVSFDRHAGTPKGDDGQVVRCTSNASFQSNASSFKRRSAAQANKNKSRLLDPPPEQKSKSGMMSAKRADDEEDDPFFDEDLPQEYKKAKFDIVIMLEFASLLLIVGALACSLTVSVLKHKGLWNLELWKWEVLVLVLICGRLFSSWAIRVIVFFVERNFLLRKRVLYFVYGLRKAVQNCLWLGLVLVAWHFLFDKKVQRATKASQLDYVTKVLVCLLVGTIIWLVKTLVVKVLASSFHVSTYFDRIQESLFNQYVIETLLGPPLVEMRKAEEEEDRITIEVENLQKAGASIPPGLNDAIIRPSTSERLVGSGGVVGSGRVQKSPKVGKDQGDDGITVDQLHRLNPKNISAWNMKRLINLVRHGSLSTLDEHISSHDDESSKQINSEAEAKAVAKKIFQNVARQGSKFIYMEDLMRFMIEDEVSKTMDLFEGASECHRISKSSLKNWVVNAFRERKALSLTLNDTKTAVNKLHRMINVLVGVIIFIIWLLILNITTTKFLLLISSQLLLVVFVFGNSCKNVFEAIIFLFVMHPFDVGDRCEIEGVQMVVEEMNILTTVFLRYDNQKIIYPNSVLATKAINNYRRSPDMGDAIEFCIHIATPPEKIATIKHRILSFIDNKKDHWCEAPLFIFKDVEELNKLRIAIWLTHRMNHQDIGERWTRRSILIEEMVKIFKELDIQYRLLPLDINVRSLPSATSTANPPFWTAPSSS